MHDKKIILKQLKLRFGSFRFFLDLNKNLTVVLVSHFQWNYNRIKKNLTPPLSYSKGGKVKDVEGWLSDLHQLMVCVKDPSYRCEEWLNAISKKFPGCAQLQIYWGCAAMYDNRGDVQVKEEQEENKSSQNDEVEDSLVGLLDELVLGEKCKSASKIERWLSDTNMVKASKICFKRESSKTTESSTGERRTAESTGGNSSTMVYQVTNPKQDKCHYVVNSLDPETRILSFKLNEAFFVG